MKHNVYVCLGFHDIYIRHIFKIIPINVFNQFILIGIIKFSPNVPAGSIIYNVLFCYSNLTHAIRLQTKIPPTYKHIDVYPNYCRGSSQIIRVMACFYFPLFTSLPLRPRHRNKGRENKRNVYFGMV